MKTLKITSFLALFMAFASFSFAQSKTEVFKVSGNCGMCKAKIEKAAKAAGASSASWDEDTKDLKVIYKTSTTNTAKIQQEIAKVGYDNAGVKASNEAYDKLHGCCKYERAGADAKASCCKDGKCVNAGEDCCKDGKCTKSTEDCCKGGKCVNASGDCCKDGKCTKSAEDCCKGGHEGSSCCKKSE